MTNACDEIEHEWNVQNVSDDILLSTTEIIIFVFKKHVEHGQ